MYNNDEGLKRGLQFNRDVLPIALHYKAVELYGRGTPHGVSSQEFSRLHARYAPRALDIVLRQRGFYVKTAQFLSQYPDAIPREYVDAFSILRDDAPSLPFPEVKAIVEAELGSPLDEVFLSFERKPLGAASIGQVHGARLRDGSEVVVKVQYPEAERQFHIDVDLSIRLAQALAPHYVDILRQLKRTFATEFDYRREARLQREAHERLRGVSRVAVPRPLDADHPLCRGKAAPLDRGLVTKRVFAMERLRGRPIDQWAADHVRDLSLREGCSTEEVLDRIRSMPLEELERLVPSERAVRAYGWLLAGRDAIRNTIAGLYNYTLGWIGTPIPLAYSPQPVNVHQVVDELFKVQAKCIFEEGFFNCDPHAGNVLLLDDGRLGLIDWGQVSQLSEPQRVRFARAVLAVAARDEPLVARLALDMGVRTERRLDWAAMKLGLFWLGSFGHDVVGDLGGATCFEQNLSRIDPLEATGEEFFAAVRCMLMTRGVAALMGFPCADSAVRMRSAAERCLQRAGEAVEVRPGAKLPPPPDVQAFLETLRASAGDLPGTE